MTSNDAPPAAEPGVLGVALRRALAGYRRRMDTELAAAGFADRRFPEGRVLHMCSGTGDITISDVGRTLGITRQGASKIVAGLRERGYLDVAPSPADGREKILTLTPRAAAYLAARREAGRAIEASLRDEIGADGIERFVRYLDALAGEETPWPGDPAWNSPALRALRRRDAQDGL